MRTKQPLSGSAQVLEYLSGYTHRVAILNERIVGMGHGGLDDGDVAFRVRADAASGKKRTLRLPATEFIDRFLKHVLPTGFKRIRHYGLLAPAQGRSTGAGAHSTRCADTRSGGDRVGGSLHAAGGTHRMACLCALRHGAFRDHRVARASEYTAGFVTGAAMRDLSEFNRRWLHDNASDKRQENTRARACRRWFPVQNTGRKCIANIVHDAVWHPSISIAVWFFSAIRDPYRLTNVPPDLQSP